MYPERLLTWVARAISLRFTPEYLNIDDREEHPSVNIRHGYEIVSSPILAARVTTCLLKPVPRDRGAGE